MSLLLGLLAVLAQDKPEPVPFTVLVKQGAPALRKAEEKVLTTTKEWTDLWDGSGSKPPAVDFAKDVVLLAAFGEKSTGGYLIDITRVEKTAAEIRVYVRRTLPRPGAILTQAFTYPVVLARTAKPDRKVVFVDEKD